MDRNRRGAGRNLLFGFAVVAAFFALAELALLAAGVRPLLEERDPFEGFSRAVRVFQRDASRPVFVTSSRAERQSFNHQEFAAIKPPGGFRVFTLGGSSAYGFPWGAGVAFTRLLGLALAASWPGRSVEAINASGMSYGSQRLRILAHEVAGYSPDVLVVYEGHNEFVETRFYHDLMARRASLDWVRAGLYRWRLYSALTRVIQRLRPGPPAAVDGEAGGNGATGRLLGLDVVREEGSGSRDETKSAARDRLEENLRDIAATARAAKARVLFCTVTSNLKDWRPNQSLFDPARPEDQRREALSLRDRSQHLLETGDAAAAGAAMDRAVTLAPEHADLWYVRGRTGEALGRWDQARADYVKARDADGQPSRALGSFNETIRRVARDTGSILVDVEKIFEEASPHGLVGFNLIEDYVHPTPQGHRIIALAIWKALNASGLPGPARQAETVEFDRAVGPAPDAAALTLAAAPDPGGARKASELLYNQAYVLEHQGLTDQAIAKYRDCLALSPGYYIAAFNLGRLLHTQRRPDLAAEQFRRALAVKPDHVLSMVGLGMALIGMDDLDGATQVLERATRADPSSAAAFDALGHTQALRGAIDAAAASFQRALELDPENAGAAARLGSMRFLQGRTDEAIASLRRSLSLQHDQPRVRDDLADVLTAAGQLDEAQRLYRESLTADADDTRAREGLESLIIKMRAGRP